MVTLRSKDGLSSILPSDLKDVRGHLLAKKGRVVDSKLIEELIQKGKHQQHQHVSLSNSPVLSMIKKVTAEPIYANIFRTESTRKKILNLAKSVSIQKGLYEEILKVKRTSYYSYRHFVLIASLAAKMSMDLSHYGYYFDPKKAFILSLTHDIGKARVPTYILNKKTPLTSNEYRILHTHPYYSLLLLSYYLGHKSGEAIEVAFGHHERIDGSGYPRGVKTMPHYTRLVTIIDIFDALVAIRPYRKRQFTVRGALDILIHDMHAGKLPDLPVRLIVSYYRTKKEDIRHMLLSERSRDPLPTGNCYGKIAKK